MSSQSASQGMSRSPVPGGQRLHRLLGVAEPAALVVAQRPQRRRRHPAGEPGVGRRIPRMSGPAKMYSVYCPPAKWKRYSSGCGELEMAAVAVVDEEAGHRVPAGSCAYGRRTGSRRSTGRTRCWSGRARGSSLSVPAVNSPVGVGFSTSVFQKVKSRPLRLSRPVFSPSPKKASSCRHWRLTMNSSLSVA